MRKELIGIEQSALEQARERTNQAEWRTRELNTGLRRAMDGAYQHGATTEEIREAIARGQECAKMRKVIDERNL